jgi:choline dehydrogenase-like flavoprotein
MPQEMGGVVDDKLRVCGCSKLRVYETSSIPTVPRTVSQSVVYPVAEHEAELIMKSMI